MAGAAKKSGSLSATKIKLIVAQLMKMEPSKRRDDLVKTMKSFK